MGVGPADVTLEPSLPVGGASWPPARPAAVSHPGCLGFSVSSNRSQHSQSGRRELPGGFLLSQHTVHLPDTSGICGAPWIQTSFALTALGFFSRRPPHPVCPASSLRYGRDNPPQYHLQTLDLPTWPELLRRSSKVPKSDIALPTALQICLRREDCGTSCGWLRSRERRL